MDKVAFIKTFPMITEIEIAGDLIYNGIKRFNSMIYFRYDSEIFLTLYDISVGIERLQKVLLILLEDIDLDRLDKVEGFTRKLITHSHQDLQERIVAGCGLRFNANQSAFLQVLTQFYNTFRYDRFNCKSDYKKEQELLANFLSSRLNIEIVFNDILWNTPNDDQMKNFFGRLVGSLARSYYDEIKKQAHSLGIYTYELRIESPAAKLFLPDFKRDSLQEQYFNEQVALKEFLVYLMNTEEKSPFIDYIRSIEPLDLDVALAEEHVVGLCKGDISQSLVDEVENLYEEMIFDIPDRIRLIGLIGDRNVIFDINEDDGEID